MAKRPNRKDWEAHSERVKAANRARYRAVKTLVSRHQVEFDALYEAESKVEGVTPRTVKDRTASLKRRIRDLQLQLDDVETGGGG